MVVIEVTAEWRWYTGTPKRRPVVTFTRPGGVFPQGVYRQWRGVLETASVPMP